MGLFQKLGRLIGIGKEPKRYPKQRISAPMTDDKNIAQHKKPVKTGNRVPYISWGSFTLQLRKPYR